MRMIKKKNKKQTQPKTKHTKQNFPSKLYQYYF